MQINGLIKILTFTEGKWKSSERKYLTQDELQRTVMLFESVSNMLGHRSLKTTRIYAKVFDEKAERDMEKLQEQLRLSQEKKENEDESQERNE